MTSSPNRRLNLIRDVLICLLAVGFSFLLPALGRSGERRPLGIVVESIPPATPASRSGLEPGDVLLTWERRDQSGNVLTHGVFDSPFDALSVFLEESPRGPVAVTGEREGVAREWTLPPSSCDIKTRPTLAPDLLERYQQARVVEALHPNDAAKAW